MTQSLEPMVPREWKLRLELDGVIEKAEVLRKETGLSGLAVRVCLMRGLESAEAIRGFLSPRLDALQSPWRIRDMDRAIDRLARARAAGERIRVYGDYDVDGTTGAALFAWVLRDFGFQFDVRQPDRFKDGYGLNVQAVEDAASDGTQVLLTVDCGISSFQAAARARELGVDLIVVDHHQIDPERGLPEAVAVINPQRTDCPSGLRQLCGCGLAFYVAIALRARGRELGWFASGSEPNLRQHLDLVVMATAADMVPLTGDNHILARHGLDVLRGSQKPGVRALLQAAGLSTEQISPGHLGFVLGPRINASGRMQSANLAFELLTSTDPVRAGQLAQQLETLNSERAEIQNRIWDQVRVRVEEGLAQGKFRNAIVVGDPSWHEGVVGIVASRVTETFRKPAIVIALRPDFGKGSVRSYAGKDVLSALRATSEQLISFGGHKHAAGVSVAPEKLESFAEAFDDAVAALQESGNAPLLIEGSCSVSELDVATLGELEQLGPFGPGNPEPVFTFEASIRQHQVIKGRHLKLSLGAAGAPSAARSGIIEAIWFHGAEQKEGPTTGQNAQWAGVPELNRFRGRVTPTIRVKDWRPSASISE